MNKLLLLGLLFTCTVTLAQEQVPNLNNQTSQELTGPITEALERLVKKNREEEAAEMRGLLDRLRDRDNTTEAQYNGILDRFKQKEELEATRHQGVLSLLKEIRDRERPDNAALFPRINDVVTNVKEMRAEQAARFAPFKALAERLEAFFWSLVKVVIAFGVLIVLVLIGLSFFIAYIAKQYNKILNLPTNLLK